MQNTMTYNDSKKCTSMPIKFYSLQRMYKVHIEGKGIASKSLPQGQIWEIGGLLQKIKKIKCFSSNKVQDILKWSAIWHVEAYLDVAYNKKQRDMRT